MSIAPVSDQEMVETVCPVCQAELLVKRSLIGKKGRCRCGEVFVIQEQELEAITCVSVQQSFADDIFFSGKWAENRSWQTSYRGELWIHSSKTADGLFSSAKERADAILESPTGLMTGAILGRVNLFECMAREELMAIAPDSVLAEFQEKRPAISNAKTERVASLLEFVAPQTWAHVGDSDHVWILAEPEMLHVPIPVGGKLRLWRVSIATARLQLADKRKRKWSLTTV